ncbi:MAG: hypothetical protein WC881_08605 [Elusimicrobiota bacterium]|jgi:hypothetical protein
MRAALRCAVPLAALLACACAGLKPGPHKAGFVQEEEVVALAESGTTPAEQQEQALITAERQAVSGLLDLYIASHTWAASTKILDDNILASPRAYIRKWRIAAQIPVPGGRKLRVRALVATAKLLRDLEGLGLVRPEGVYGTPRILLALQEKGLGAGRDVGRASDALRRQMSARGYEVQDFSDRLNAKHQDTGSVIEAAAAAKAAGANVLIYGAASAAPVRDDRLAGYSSFSGQVSAQAYSVPAARVLASETVQATAVDMSPLTAAAKALENAGDLAAEKLAADLGDVFRERSEIVLAVSGLAGMERLHKLTADVRALPGVAGAVVTYIGPGGARLLIFVEKLSPDELAARLLRLPGYAFIVRTVEADYRYLEMESSGGQ